MNVPWVHIATDNIGLGACGFGVLHIESRSSSLFKLSFWVWKSHITVSVGRRKHITAFREEIARRKALACDKGECHHE